MPDLIIDNMLIKEQMFADCKSIYMSKRQTSQWSLESPVNASFVKNAESVYFCSPPLKSIVRRCKQQHDAKMVTSRYLSINSPELKVCRFLNVNGEFNECWLYISIKTTTSQWSLESMGPSFFTVTLNLMKLVSGKYSCTL